MKQNNASTTTPLDQTVEILKKRADQLAIPLKSYNYDFIEILVFNLSNEQYGIELQFVKEVYPYKELTPLPGTPSFMVGLINVRRKIFSLIDLKVFFSLPQDTQKEKKAIILQNLDHEFALLTDEIKGVKKIPLTQIQPSLPTFTGIRQEFLKGVTTESLVILDGEKLLNSKQLIVDMVG